MLFSLKKIVLLLSLVCQIQPRKSNEHGLNIIREYEKFHRNFYDSELGIRSIGYGHDCHENDCSKIKAPITEVQADAILRRDIVRFEKCVNDANKVGDRFNEDMFSAVVSLAFNVGCRNILELMKALNSDDFEKIAMEFTRLGFFGGSVNPDMEHRRLDEYQLFCNSGDCKI